MANQALFWSEMKFMPGTAIQRLHRLDPTQRRLLVRAAAVLSEASAAVALLPFSRAIRFGSVPLDPKRDDRTATEWVWAVETVAHRLPWRTMCIEKGLAVQRLLRRSGMNAVLHYGARHEPETGKLQAHVWVSVGGKTVIGGEEAAGYGEIATFA